MFQNILCPVNFDPISLSVLDAAVDLARANHGKLHLLYVAPMPRESFGEPIPLEQFSPPEHEARQQLERMAAERIKERAPYDVAVASGDPAMEILNAAADPGIDVVVMATHGRKGLKRLVLGSVAERVIRESPRPVLTIRPS